MKRSVAAAAAETPASRIRLESALFCAAKSRWVRGVGAFPLDPVELPPRCRSAGSAGIQFELPTSDALLRDSGTRIRTRMDPMPRVLGTLLELKP